MKISLIFLVLMSVGCSGFCDPCVSNALEKRSFSFDYSVEIPATHGKKLEVWLPLPQTNEVQTISNIKITADDLSYKIMEDYVHGNSYLYLISEIGLEKTTQVSFSFDVNRSEHKNEHYAGVMSHNYLGSYLMVPTGQMFTNIINKNQLTKSDMRAVYDFVLSGMHYGKPKSIQDKYYQNPWLNVDSRYGEKKVSRDEVVSLYQQAVEDGGNYTFGNGNSVYACDIGVGNCTDYHSYFMSLGRTMDVPVRFHMGFPIPEAEAGIVGGYHCWADYFVDGEGWYPVDISEADKEPAKIDYFFGTVCKNRVEMTVGRDIELEGYENKTANLFIYPIVEVDDIESTNFTKTFSYKNI